MGNCKLCWLLLLGFFFLKVLTLTVMIHPRFLFKMWGPVTERDRLCGMAWPLVWMVSMSCLWASAASWRVAGSQKWSLNCNETVKYSANSTAELRKSFWGILLWRSIDLKMRLIDIYFFNRFKNVFMWMWRHLSCWVLAKSFDYIATNLPWARPTS